MDSRSVASDAAALLGAAAQPVREPCIMYLDSMAGTKPKTFRLLKIYLELERKDKMASKNKDEEAKKKDEEARNTTGKPRKVEGEGALGTSIAAASPAASPPSDSAAPPAAASTAAPPAPASTAPPVSSQKSEDCMIVEPTVGGVLGTRGRASGSVDPTAEVHEYRGEFDGLPEYDIEVPNQINGYDCGLYMLQFVSRAAHEQPDLAGAHKRRWVDAECQGGGKLGLKDLSPEDITEMRLDMYRTIEALGEEQQARKKAKAEEQGDQQHPKKKAKEAAMATWGADEQQATKKAKVEANATCGAMELARDEEDEDEDSRLPRTDA